jgi:hypothetical protein
MSEYLARSWFFKSLSLWFYSSSGLSWVDWHDTRLHFWAALSGLEDPYQDLTLDLGRTYVEAECASLGSKGIVFEVRMSGIIPESELKDFSDLIAKAEHREIDYDRSLEMLVYTSAAFKQSLLADAADVIKQRLFKDIRALMERHGIDAETFLAQIADPEIE